MIYYFKKATINDLALLSESRVRVLIDANRLPADTDMSEAADASKDYYATALLDGTHTAYLVFQGDALVATGGISYYCVMPTYHNPSGYKAYLMNIWTAPEWRRRGIARRVVELLIDDAKNKGVTEIGLEATETGRMLYERCGFVPATNEMTFVFQ